MTKLNEIDRERVAQKRQRPLASPSDLGDKAARDIAAAMNAALADVFALYLKTKSFHWHLSGPHFRDYHLLLDEHADQLLAMTDPIAERVRKLGARTLTSIGHVARLRAAHDVCEEHRDFATTSQIEIWLDEAERRSWFLFETTRRQDSGGR